MRLKDNCSGQYAVMLAFILPVFVVMISAVVVIGNLTDAKVRLQAALDRGMYAGAARLSFLMNRAGELAWEYHKSYRDLRDIFESTSQQSSSEGESKLNELETKQNELLRQIDEISRGMYAQAHRTVYEVLDANLHLSKGFAGTPDYKICAGLPVGIADEMLCDWMPAINRSESAFSIVTADTVDLSYDYIQGDFADPSDKGGGGRAVVPFIMKDGSRVAIAGEAEMNVRIPLLHEVFGDTLRMRVASAGQSYGGSIRSFGLLSGDDLNAVAESDDGRKYRYHPSLISFRGISSGVNDANFAQ